MTPQALSLWRPLVHSWEGWALCVVLAGVVPFHGVFAYRRLRTGPDPVPTAAKLKLYATIVVMEWSLVALALVIAFRHDLGLADLGQGLANEGTTLAVTVLGFVALLGLTVFNVRQIRHAGREELEATVQRARKFVPVGRTEIAAFAAVSFTAGVCEELLYRGWMVNFFGALFGSIWIGMIVAAIFFGLGHAYQGRQGIVATGVLGIVFGTMFVLVRSLVPGQIVHAAIDLVNGILAGRVVKRLGASAPPSAAQEQQGG
ncbi:MAG TPA: CPBP family intramembrane glutamic endopeptidase, partial [Candidatus Limnocylindrales bacterium]|nr:CPBP family intramembrane glutamic endopeptidase [Candidatus Limnocylindrales bacterium]